MWGLLMVAQSQAFVLNLSSRNLQDVALVGDTAWAVGEVANTDGGGGYGGNNVALVKILPDGSVAWDTTYGTVYDDGATAVDVRNDTLVVAGYLRSSDNTVNYELFLGTFSTLDGSSFAIKQWGVNGYDVATGVDIGPDTLVWVSWVSTFADQDACVGAFSIRTLEMAQDAGVSVNQCFAGSGGATDWAHDVATLGDSVVMMVGSTAGGQALVFFWQRSPFFNLLVYGVTFQEGGVSRGPAEARSVVAVGDTFLVVGHVMDTVGGANQQAVWLAKYDASGQLRGSFAWKEASPALTDTLEVRAAFARGDTLWIAGNATTTSTGEDALLLAVNWHDGTVFWARSWALSAGNDRFRGVAVVPGKLWAVGTADGTTMTVLHGRSDTGEACGTWVEVPMVLQSTWLPAQASPGGSAGVKTFTSRNEETPRTAWDASTSLCTGPVLVGETRQRFVPFPPRGHCRYVSLDGRCLSQPACGISLRVDGGSRPRKVLVFPGIPWR